MDIQRLLDFELETGDGGHADVISYVGSRLLIVSDSVLDKL